MSTATDHALDSENKNDSAFVEGLVASERPSAKVSVRTAEHGEKRKSFVPLRDLNVVQETIDPLKDAGNGKLAIADVEDGEFEPVWGAETKPRSQREIFLAEQAFAEGKKQGEEEAGKRAHAQGLQEGRESGYKKGFQDGEKERKGEIEQRAQEMAKNITDKRIETIATFLEQLMQREKEASHKRDTELMALMIAIFDKVLPALAEEHGEKEVQLFLKAILRRFENIPQISITLAEGEQALAALLRERVLVDDKSLVSFHFDPSFSKADCKIAWAEGEVERRFHDLWQEVKHALQQHLPQGKRADAAKTESAETESAESAKTESAKTESAGGAGEAGEGAEAVA